MFQRKLYDLSDHRYDAINPSDVSKRDLGNVAGDGLGGRITLLIVKTNRYAEAVVSGQPPGLHSDGYLLNGAAAVFVLEHTLPGGTVPQLQGVRKGPHAMLHG